MPRKPLDTRVDNFDSTTAFLAFSGGARQKLNGVSLSDSAFMGYFTAYSDQQWTSLPSLGAYLEQLDS